MNGKCPCRIHPLPNDTIIECDSVEGHASAHAGVLRDYAYPGSETLVTWMHEDRRNFTGDWIECPSVGCTLPANHRGDHAV